MLVLRLKVILSVILTFEASKRVSKNSEKSNDIFGDVPIIDDLHSYLDSVMNIVKFCNEQKVYLNVNFAFGMFLLQVNLKNAYKTRNLPSTLKNEIYNVLQENDKLLQFFKNKVKKANNGRRSLITNIKSLFLYELPWIKRLGKFKPPRPESPLFRSSRTRRTDPDWIDYQNKIPNYDMWTPNPDMSDYCISSLANAHIITPELICNVPGICHHMLRNGTDFGYAITHRLLFLLQADFGRGCSIYSLTEDRKIRQELCRRIYKEAQYIVAHDYDYLDLLLEQIALCSLGGHSEFIHRSWLNRILLYQTPLGCFRDKLQRSIHTTRSKDQAMLKVEDDLLDGACNAHLTGVAAATFGAAVRFIIEMYY